MLSVDAEGKIQLTRGDTARFEVNITNDMDGSNYELQDGDVLRFTVKKSTDKKDALISKEITDGNIIYIAPEDTQNLSYGSYYYDVELTTKGKDVYTIIPPSKFVLLKEVTW